MNKNKFVIATTAFASCSILSYLGLSNNSEMMGMGPVALANYSIDYTNENAFSQYIVQNSSLNNILGAYKPSWFYASPLIGNAASVYLVPQKEVPVHETIKVRS